jgi:hypothetical protein
MADAQAGLRINLGGRGFFHELLMTALNGALALAQVDHPPVLVAQNLKLDMPGRGNVLFQIDIGSSKRCRRLILRRPKKMGKVVRRGHNPHSPAAATRRGFDHNGVADALRFPQGVFLRRNHFRAWQHRQGPTPSFWPSPILVAHQADDFRAGPDKGEIGSLANVGKVGALRQKTIPGMNGFRAGYFRAEMMLATFK